LEGENIVVQHMVLIPIIFIWWVAGGLWKARLCKIS